VRKLESVVQFASKGGMGIGVWWGVDGGDPMDEPVGKWGFLAHSSQPKKIFGNRIKEKEIYR